MRICLAFCDTAKELFLSERGQWLFILADVFKRLGHSVTLRPIGEVGWWSSGAVQRLIAAIAAVGDESQFDVVLDIGGSVSASLRRQLSKTVVVFLYNNVLFDELQDVPYLSKTVKKHTQRGSVDYVWIWEGQEEYCPLLSTLYHCPVHCVPFIWSPLVIEELCSAIVLEREGPIEEGSYSVFQTNQENTMCAVWPLSFLNERRARAGSVSSCVVFDLNGVLQKSKFYKENIESNLVYKSELSYVEFTTVEELYKTCSKRVTIFHTRYKPYQIHIFNFLWMGLPLIHNSPVVDSNYFRDNSFAEAEKALDAVYRAGRDRTWSFTGGSGSSGWAAMLRTLPSVPAPACKTILSFTDMWEGFDVQDNFFIDLLRSRGISGISGVEGVHANSALHICGPFGARWQGVSSKTPIVFFSGERWARSDAYEKSAISLFLTHDVEEDERHVRLPLWILFLELWGRSQRSQRNPNGLPLSYATGEGAGEWKSRKRFCGFVVSNPMNPERNAAFELLNAYEEVDSGGAYKNNIGGPIAHMYGGGGGGDVAKHAFLKERKFCLCYENSSAPGYVTEKLLHAKMAGCVPIYGGCPEAGLVDFDPRGFIDMTGVPVNDIVARVEEVYTDKEMSAYMASIPALGDAELGRMWACVQRVGSALMGLLQKHKGNTKITTIKMANEVIEGGVAGVAVATGAPLFVSFITKQFIPSIEYALESVKKMGDPRIEYLLYIGGDVEEEDIRGIKSTYEGFLTVRKIPCDTVEGFPDFWNPRYFGWKLWIYNQIVHEFPDRLLVYSDAGAQWLHPYPEMFEKAWASGICFVLDTNKNRFWCSEEMIAEMRVTEEELEVPQILGGIMAIRGGHKGAMAFFNTCLQYAYNPRNLQGRKLIRILPGGQPVGHRHDQSIMSVERVRSGMGFGFVTQDKATCMESLRRTLQLGVPIYLHRGNYVVNAKALQNVDDVWIINLERRMDRIVSFHTEYPTLGEIVRRFSAIDGKLLQLTPAITHMFYHNDFQWKKSVLGCALSHILLWAQLACEGPGVQSYLILEDDVRFLDRDLIDTVLEELPSDVEVAYLGGVLPRNRAVYSQAIEPVNKTWAEIKPNTFFSKQPMPVFHHCNYAYYLTKAGARRLLDSLVTTSMGCFTSIDHYMGHPIIGMKKYVLMEPIAVCFQDADPTYVNAAFDDFQRVDTYDSDIWNNVDMYKVPVPKDFQPMVTPLSIPSVYPMVCDVLRQIPSSRETCTLLSPGPFLHMLSQEKRLGEMAFVKQFLEQLQADMVMPARISFGRRTDAMVCKGGELSAGDCTAISIVESSGENYNKSCLMSKMFFVGKDDDVHSIVKRTANFGAVPIYVRRDGDEVFWGELRGRLGLVELRTWTTANTFISILLEQVEKGERYRWGIVEKCVI